MIIQTGMRTDIPAFYSKWFLNRLHEGYVLVRNPYEPSMVTRYRLDPEVVDLIGFCSKNPTPMLPHLHELRDYGQYWFVTITPYGTDIEPHVPPKEQVMETFKRLSDAVGPDAVAWRYDPILLTETYTMERHLEDFGRMTRNLSGYTTSCVISFVDLYQKVKRNFPTLRALTHEEKMELGKQMIQIANDSGMTLRPCAEGNDLERYGADCGGCMTVSLYEKALGCHLNAPRRKNQRGGECACLLGTDIGAYDTCGHLCRYCYANTDAALVKENMLRHDTASPFLVGNLLPGDTVHEAKQERWADDQLMLS